MSVRRLEKFKTKRTFSICIFGFSGNGKSSLVNTLYSLRSGQKRVKKHAEVRVGDSIDQQTVTYDEYRFGEKVRVFDTWGLVSNEVKSNYDPKEFSAMLEGSVASGKSGKGFKIDEKIQKRIINVIVFAFDPQVVCQEEELKKIKPYYAIAKSLNKRCMVVVTKIDLWAKTKLKLNLLEKSDPALMYPKVTSSDDWLEEIQKPINKYLDERAEVHPIINYKSITSKKNRVVSYFAEEFVESLTDGFHEDYCRKCGKKTCKGQCVNVPNKRKKMYKVDLFAGEKPIRMRFVKEEKGEGSMTPITSKTCPEFDVFIQEKKKKSDGIKNKKKKRKKGGNTSGGEMRKHFVFPEIFFRTLQMGAKTFRFFVSSSLMCPNELVIGLYHHNSRRGGTITYFEARVKDAVFFEKVEEAFSDNFVGSYEFISTFTKHEENPQSEEEEEEEEEEESDSDEDEDQQEEEEDEEIGSTYELNNETEYVHIGLLGGELKLLLKKHPRFPGYAGVLESHIQLIKKNTLMEEKTSRMMKEFGLLTEKYDDKVFKDLKIFNENLHLVKNESAENKISLTKLKEEVKNGYMIVKVEMTDLIELRCEKCEKTMGELKDEVIKKFEEEKKKLESIIDDRVLELIGGGGINGPVTQHTSATYGQRNGNYIIWDVENNGCSMYVDQSVSNYSYKMSKGTYLVLWKSFYSNGGNNYISLYKRGAAIDYSYRSSCGNYYNSPMVMKVVEMDGIRDDLQFYSSTTPNASKLYHSLVIIRLQDPGSPRIGRTGEMSVWNTSADYAGSSGNYLLWRMYRNAAGMNVHNTHHYRLPCGKYLVFWKSTMQSNANQYISLYKNGSVIDYSYGSSCGTGRWESPCVLKMVDMNGTNDYLQFYRSYNHNTSSNHHSLEILKLQDYNALPRFGRIPMRTTSCDYNTHNSNNVIWNIRNNGCNLYVQSTHQYYMPHGLYLILWKSTYHSTNSHGLSLYKNGAVIDYSYESSCGSYYHSASISKVLYLNGSGDFLRFYINTTPYGGANYHSLEIIKFRE